MTIRVPVRDTSSPSDRDDPGMVYTMTKPHFAYVVLLFLCSACTQDMSQTNNRTATGDSCGNRLAADATAEKCV